MPRLLIINADDLGYDPAVTTGILEAMDRGVVSSATLMVNTPSSADAAHRARGRAVGLHLNLARWAPVWPAFPAGLLTGGVFDEARAGQLPAEVVEAEALAQVDRFEATFGAPPTHVDVHKHLHLLPAVFEGLCAAAQRRSLPVRSLDGAMRELVRARQVRTCDAFLGEAGPEAFWTLNRLREQLSAAPLANCTELMCHPGYPPSSVKSGYAEQRQVELETFLHPGARALVAHLGFTLVGYADLP
jgi:predicted glycoside hydrolase/deacetylase ChbG (UPF0249 family)